MTAKIRPCLIVSIPALDQDRALATVLPHTTSSRGSRFEVDIKTRFLRPGVFDAQNLVTIPHAKLIRKLGTLTAEQLVTIDDVIRLWLDL
jgi:mRNA interferase MazF